MEERGKWVDGTGVVVEERPSVPGAPGVVGSPHNGTVAFRTGATRSAENMFDPEGFLCPEVIAIYSDYMARHRVQKDGKLRASDNWQKGMPTSRAFRSMTRHFLDLWLLHRGYSARSADCKSPEDALCAILFNVMLILKNRADNNHHEVDL